MLRLTGPAGAASVVIDDAVVVPEGHSIHKSSESDPVTITIRAARHCDLPTLQCMNESALPAVNSVPVSFFERYLSVAGYLRVAETGGRVVGFVQVMSAAEDYRSLNFQWFKARYSEFVYIDRVVVDAAARGCGVGEALYNDVRRTVEHGVARIVCEVNLRPLNARSLRFHKRLGFEPVGTQVTDQGRKTVQLMCLTLPAACRPLPDVHDD